MIAPRDGFYSNGRTEGLIALRELFSRNPRAAQVGPETLSDLVYEEGYLSRKIAVHELECALEALIVEGEVLG